MTDAERLTVEQAYEAAYRFIWQYMQRELNPDCVSLPEMLVALEPVGDQARTNDPASWPDWLTCVADTLDGASVPRFRSTH